MNWQGQSCRWVSRQNSADQASIYHIYISSCTDKPWATESISVFLLFNSNYLLSLQSDDISLITQSFKISNGDRREKLFWSWHKNLITDVTECK